MGKIKIILFICIISVFCSASDWSPIGPDTVKVNDYLSSFFGDLLCIHDGLLVYDWQGNDWVKYSNAKMPAIQAADYDTSGIMVILSDSSWSDGIYKFDFKKKQFEVLQYAAFPRFLYYYYPSGTYFCGYGYGLLKSDDGTNWEEVEFFKGKDCRAACGLDDILLVADKYDIYYSHDQGKSWTTSAESPNNVSAITRDWDGTYFAVFPGTSRSSGLWSSVDSGKTWQVEFWSTHMSTTRCTYRELFVGWEQPVGEYSGVGIWNKSDQKLTLLNDGLPNTSINRFSENTLIDCINVVACTDGGAYMTCGFPTTLGEKTQRPEYLSLDQNYPNPFNPKTAISYKVMAQNLVPILLELSVYNNLGQKVTTLVSGVHHPGNYNVEWDADAYPSGIYYYRLNTEKGFSETKKMILLR